MYHIICPFSYFGRNLPFGSKRNEEQKEPADYSRRQSFRDGRARGIGPGSGRRGNDDPVSFDRQTSCFI